MKPLPPHIETLFSQAQAAFDNLLAATPSQDAKVAVDTWMQHTLARMGAVPRAEFDIQRDMLLALRQRVEQLEAMLVQSNA